MRRHLDATVVVGGDTIQTHYISRESGGPVDIDADDVVRRSRA